MTPPWLCMPVTHAPSITGLRQETHKNEGNGGVRGREERRKRKGFKKKKKSGVTKRREREGIGGQSERAGALGPHQCFTGSAGGRFQGK